MMTYQRYVSTRLEQEFDLGMWLYILYSQQYRPEPSALLLALLFLAF